MLGSSRIRPYPFNSPRFEAEPPKQRHTQKVHSGQNQRQSGFGQKASESGRLIKYPCGISKSFVRQIQIYYMCARLQSQAKSQKTKQLTRLENRDNPSRQELPSRFEKLLDLTSPASSASSSASNQNGGTNKTRSLRQRRAIAGGAARYIRSGKEPQALSTENGPFDLGVDSPKKANSGPA